MTQDTLDWMNRDRVARGLDKVPAVGRRSMPWPRSAPRAWRPATPLSHDAAGGDLGVEYDHSGIQWYGYGEIIGVSNATFGKPSAAMIYKLWKGSAPHAAIMFSSHYNYIGIGFAYRASNNTTWASIVFADSKDHTAAKVARDGRHVRGRTVTFGWRGHDRVPPDARGGARRLRRRGPGGRRAVADGPEQHPRDVPDAAGSGARPLVRLPGPGVGPAR